MLPLGCLPLWGREGVTLIFSSKYNLKINNSKISSEPNFKLLFAAKTPC